MAFIRKTMKIPRKLKKGLKSEMVNKVSSHWKSSQIKIIRAERRSRYISTNATFKGLTLMFFELG